MLRIRRNQVLVNAAFSLYQVIHLLDCGHARLSWGVDYNNAARDPGKHELTCGTVAHFAPPDRDYEFAFVGKFSVGYERWFVVECQPMSRQSVRPVSVL